MKFIRERLKNPKAKAERMDFVINDNISYTSIYPNVVCNKITGSVSIIRSNQGNSVYTSNPDDLSSPDFLRSCGIVV